MDAILRLIPIRAFSAPLLSALWLPILYTTIDSTGLLCSIWQRGDNIVDQQVKSPPATEIFDFIVVGAGTSGSVVAKRLSEQYKVLLLEAGGEPHPFQNIPGFGFFLINRPELDWMHTSTVQKKACLNSVNQRSSWSSGLGLGGTTTLNLFIHLRGHKKDYDNWARLTQDPSWSWEQVLPFFKRHEDYEQGGDKKFHGFGGDLRIETPSYIGMGPEFVEAGKELGYQHVDLNADYDEGFDLTKYPIKNGARQATYWAFLQPIRRRRSLTILKYSHVNKVLIDENNVAYGIEYDRHGETRKAYCSKEVILSAGTMNTAKLLMLSGIGPANHLQKMGIRVKRDLPVGKNLQDHIAVYMNPFFINKKRSSILTRDGSPSSFVQWFATGHGPLSSPGSHAVGCFSSSHAKARGEGDWPDLQLTLFSVGVFSKFGETMAHAFGLKYDEMRKYYRHAVNKDSYMISVSGARPLSRGYIQLGGSDPYDKLVIEPNYLGDGPADIDFKVLLEGVKTAVILAENTTALGKNLGSKFTDMKLPGCEQYTMRSDAYWECYIRRYTVTLHHPAGTAAMGPIGAPWAVTDSRLNVQGVKRLRVIDNSIQPVLVVTNSAAAALMIGEKGAHTVLQDWQTGIRRNDNSTSV